MASAQQQSVVAASDPLQDQFRCATVMANLSRALNLLQSEPPIDHATAAAALDICKKIRARLIDVRFQSRVFDHQEEPRRSPQLIVSQSAPSLRLPILRQPSAKQNINTTIGHVSYRQTIHESFLTLHARRFHLQGQPERSEEQRLEEEEAMAERVRLAVNAAARSEKQRRRTEFKLLTDTARRLPRWYTDGRPAPNDWQAADVAQPQSSSPCAHCR